MIDSFGRKHNYLRISLTERCNLRCTYCMPAEGIQLRPKAHFMTKDEIIAIAKVFVLNGVTKIRLTGGEPLVRKDFGAILMELSKLPVELHMTTNAVLLDQFEEEILSSGMKSINISLDSLIKERFQKITRRNDMSKVLSNIQLFKDKLDIRINTVLMKDTNRDELIDFIEFGQKENIPVRFIEFMPFDGNNWDRNQTVEQKTILESVAKHFHTETLIQKSTHKNDTTKYYHLSKSNVPFGVISTVTNPFCDSCNRIRLTADGKIKNCLFSNFETDLLSVLRKGEDIIPLILKNIQSKKKQLGGLVELSNETKSDLKNRSMIAIGG